MFPFHKGGALAKKPGRHLPTWARAAVHTTKRALIFPVSRFNRRADVRNCTRRAIRQNRAAALGQPNPYRKIFVRPVFASKKTLAHAQRERPVTAEN